MPVSISQYWAQLDEMGRAVAFLLIAMSFVSWFTIFAKSWVFWRIRRSAPDVNRFWDGATMEDAIMTLELVDVERVFVPMVKAGVSAVNSERRVTTMMHKADTADIMTRVLRQEMNKITVRLESGLTLLASIGATAPFIGLLGTVWGIYHALTAVSGSAAIQIDLVAGPVGEALVMTGLGLMVAIPAVLAYNAFNRINRITLAELDGFAYDLHTHLSKSAS
ncbi:MotA/TolQ/ExbB proton channel family protein [Undibacterium cyanobacteriorum]|uniref:Biopolymer transport protein ExbB n=1 Tax=Undibacterium cyanobacteriorum TaxID=3073561 RepID=A0ABY9RDY8_9BURK|nr:MotA/TolQ/ExbB proton channel family protein [Undibacterium sp. 20NA77.5]WMW79427.1 MotA/TolQ/ExbB proton channel family protein [Undibacterium sp. 20NA77.5]